MRLRRFVFALLVLSLAACATGRQHAAAPGPRAVDGRPVPVYPAMLATAGVSVTVTVAAEVDARGRVTPGGVTPVGDGWFGRPTTDSLLLRAVSAAVTEWRFVGGPGRAEIALSFVLAGAGERGCPAQPPAGAPVLAGESSFDVARQTATVVACAYPICDHCIDPPRRRARRAAFDGASEPGAWHDPEVRPRSRTFALGSRSPAGASVGPSRHRH